jgi:hypothetical protein
MNSDGSSLKLAGEEALPLGRVYQHVLVSYLVFLAFLRLFGGQYWSLVCCKFGDNPSYLQAAAAIRHWHFSGIIVKQFWGLPYAIAGLSLTTGLREEIALVVVCVSASLVAVACCYVLWDGWIAAFFAVLSLDWFQRSILGGAEPLFLAMLLSCFLALRRGRWRTAAVLGALATVVRPFGIFALIGLAAQLLYQRRFRDCATATAIASGIGALYAWPFAHYFGSPLANVDLYSRNDWNGGLPFGVPLVAILRDTIHSGAPLTNLVLTWGWILFVLVSLVVALRSGGLQQYAKQNPAEACFVILYSLALYTYSAPGWSRSNFPRFALPLLPWVLMFLRRYIPRRRSVVWALSVITPALAAASAVGIHQVAKSALTHIR